MCASVCGGDRQTDRDAVFESVYDDECCKALQCFSEFLLSPLAWMAVPTP